MENHGAVFVIKTNYYRDAFTDEVDSSNPLEAIAQREYELAVLAYRRSQGGFLSGGWERWTLLDVHPISLFARTAFWTCFQGISTSISGACCCAP